MDELDDRREFVMRLPPVTHRAGRKEHQCGPQPLAATVDDVFRDLPDENDVRVKTFTNDCVDCLHVGGNRRVELLSRQGGALAEKRRMLWGWPAWRQHDRVPNPAGYSALLLRCGKDARTTSGRSVMTQSTPQSNKVCARPGSFTV